MSKYLDTYMIKEVFESAGFKIIKNWEYYDDLFFETDHKGIYIPIMNKTWYAYISVDDKPEPPRGVNKLQFMMDCDEVILKKSYSNVYRDENSITILGSNGELRIIYDEYCQAIYDFQYYEFHPVTLSSMGSNTGSGCNTLHNEPICARIEDDDDIFPGINL